MPLKRAVSLRPFLSAPHILRGENFRAKFPIAGKIIRASEAIAYFFLFGTGIAPACAVGVICAENINVLFRAIEKL